MLLLEVDAEQYRTQIEDGIGWLKNQQKTNGAWQFSSAWQNTEEYPQVIAEAMAALARAATALTV